MQKKPTWEHRQHQDPPKSKSASTNSPEFPRRKKRSLKDKLNESSQSEMEEFTRIADPEKISKRAIAAFRRVTLRMIFVATLSLMRRVERYWEARSLGSDFPQEELVQEKRKSSTQKRRDDLTGVGEPMAPTPKTYPICRSVCTHEDTAGQTYLQAQGGQRRCQLTKKNIPMYLWVCRACGARWQRVPVEEPQTEVLKGKSGTALQPTPTKSSGLKTSAKREIKTMEVAIHSGEDHQSIDALMNTDLDEPGDRPRQG